MIPATASAALNGGHALRGLRVVSRLDISIVVFNRCATGNTPTHLCHLVRAFIAIAGATHPILTPALQTTFSGFIPFVRHGSDDYTVAELNEGAALGALGLAHSVGRAALAVCLIGLRRSNQNELAEDAFDLCGGLAVEVVGAHGVLLFVDGPNIRA